MKRHNICTFRFNGGLELHTAQDCYFSDGERRAFSDIQSRAGSNINTTADERGEPRPEWGTLQAFEVGEEIIVPS
jgi:hypothetical protein